VDTMTTVIIIALVVLAVIAFLVWGKARRNRSLDDKRGELRERFGPEYDRAVQEHGDERKAASELDSLARKRDKLEIRPLAPAQQQRYEDDWTAVQAAFVDAPEAAVRDADRLVGSVMRDRGYPVDDFDEQADMVRADHPTVAEHYRAARAIRVRTEEGGGSYTTEDLRQAFVHYRALFAELLDTGDSGRHRMDEDAMGDQPMMDDRMGDQRMTDDRTGDQRMDLTDRERTTQQQPPPR
jgi:hypothetical protein